MNLPICGKTPDGRTVYGGAFQLADSQGIPLCFSLDQADEKGFCISIPHFFASAIEHGWDDKQAFSKIREALSDRGESKESQKKIEDSCIVLFMSFVDSSPESDPREAARKMREALERN